MKIIKGQVAVITGAGGGIGRCLAVALADKGCNLALVDINPEALAATQAAISHSGVSSSLHHTDITDNLAMQQLAIDVVGEHGGVNILINNAGITIQKSFETHSIEDWQRMIGINFWGLIYGCKYFLPALKDSGKTGGAHIVNMSSMAGLSGLPNQATYCALKSAVRTLSETLWSELCVDNIGVTAVIPGCVRTEMILATLQESDDVETAAKSYAMAQKIGVSAEYAAARIVSAVEKNRLRLRIGKDAVLIDILKRLIPITFTKQMARITRKVGA